MDRLDEDGFGSTKRATLWAIGLSVLVLTLISLDIAGDYQEGVTWRHIVIEWAILMVSLIGVIYFGKRFYHLTQRKIGALTKDLNLATQEAQHWRNENRELIAGLAAQIRNQFQSWQLTGAEAEVGLLLLKGLSLLEISQLRSASERTIRDQARAVYRKSGLAGRSELSAFFLEDLLPPRE